jgi:hypothetical protein
MPAIPAGYPLVKSGPKFCPIDVLRRVKDLPNYEVNEQEYIDNINLF